MVEEWRPAIGRGTVGAMRFATVVVPAIAVVIGLAAAPAPAHADEYEKGSFGAGLIVGEPTGITARLYLSDDRAVQAAVGFTFIGDGWQAHADYCFHPWILEERDSFTLPVYVGPGARTVRYTSGRGSADDFYAIGLRAVAGIVFDFKTVPLDAFLEVAGIAEYGFRDDKGFGLSINFGGGVRYYF